MQNPCGAGQAGFASPAPGTMAANPQTTAGGAVAVNPIEAQKHLKTIKYPASKEVLASPAESNDPVERPRNLPDRLCTGHDDVRERLERS